MRKRSRWILALGSLLLIGTYFLPLWSINVAAPQYPEGLGIYIRINTVDGHHPNDLNNLNIVNHYIGMQKIVPESIPELRFMPFIVGFLMLSGLLIAWKGGPRLIFAWLILFSILAIAGLIDFYLWNYDFGHNLDTEHAAIQIKGMTYQPPLFGTKTMLNFVTTSLPASGGLLAFASLFLGFTTTFLNWRDSRIKLKRDSALMLMLCLALITTACEPTVQQINYGQDGCSYCRMTIVDDLYGTEVLTNKGKSYKFDSIECLAAFVIKDEVATDQIRDLYFTDFEDAGKFHPLNEMLFVQAKKLKSPMGLNLSAFRNPDTALNVAKLYFGEIMTWEQVRSYVSEAWLK